MRSGLAINYQYKIILMSQEQTPLGFVEVKRRFGHFLTSGKPQLSFKIDRGLLALFFQKSSGLLASFTVLLGIQRV